MIFEELLKDFNLVIQKSINQHCHLHFQSQFLGIFLVKDLCMCFIARLDTCYHLLRHYSI